VPIFPSQLLVSKQPEFRQLSRSGCQAVPTDLKMPVRRKIGARLAAVSKRWATVTAPAALQIQTSHPVRLTERAAAMPDHSQTAGARLASGRGSDCHSEIANSLKQRKDLRTIGWRTRARQPELRKGAGGAAGIFRLKGRRRLGRFAPPAAR
jgi:hypothetical protein